MDKTGSPPTTADYAMSSIADCDAQLRRLREDLLYLSERVDQIIEWTEEAAEAINRLDERTQPI